MSANNWSSIIEDFVAGVDRRLFCRPANMKALRRAGSACFVLARCADLCFNMSARVARQAFYRLTRTSLVARCALDAGHFDDIASQTETSK